MSLMSKCNARSFAGPTWVASSAGSCWVYRVAAAFERVHILQNIHDRLAKRLSNLTRMTVLRWGSGAREADSHICTVSPNLGQYLSPRICARFENSMLASSRNCNFSKLSPAAHAHTLKRESAAEHRSKEKGPIFLELRFSSAKQSCALQS